MTRRMMNGIQVRSCKRVNSGDHQEAGGNMAVEEEGEGIEGEEMTMKMNTSMGQKMTMMIIMMKRYHHPQDVADLDSPDRQMDR
jgi:hypothetical protein